MRTRPCALFLFTLALSAPPAGAIAAQPTDPASPPKAHQPAPAPCTLKPRFVVGRRLVYQFECRTEMRSPTAPVPAGNPRPIDPAEKVFVVYTQAVALRLTALGIDDSGAATFSLVFQRVKNELLADGKTEAAELGDQQPPPGENPGQDDSAVSAITKAMIDAAVRVDIRPDGTVSSISGLGHAGEVASKFGRQGGAILGVFAPSVVERTIAALFRLDSPDPAGTFSARSPGDAWQLVDRWPLGRFGRMVTTASMHLESCVDSRAQIAGDLKVTLEPPEAGGRVAIDPNAPRLIIDEQAGSAAATFDTAAGVMVSRSREMVVGTSTQLGSARVPSQRVKSKLEIKLLENAEPK